MECYLDNSATTKAFDEVIEAVKSEMSEYYGNPSSMHIKGFEAEKKIKETTKIIASTLKCDESEIIYTSGGTEADNMALIGISRAYKRSGKHIITSSIEHAAILQSAEFLKEEGYEITYLSTDSKGVVNLEELENAIREDTILVSVMGVNNEIGTVEPIEKISEIIKKKNPNTLFHVDAVQAYGKIKLIPKKMGIDLLSVSGHKIHGPKGIGFLYVSYKIKIKPIIFGGGQQKNMRSGTENVCGIMGLGAAVKKIFDNFDEDTARMRELREYMINGLKECDGVMINGADLENSAPHIVSASVKGVRAEVLLHSLEEKGIYISSGSACASNKPAVSATLKAIGVDKDLLDSTVRFSFSVMTTKDEIDYALLNFKETIEKLRLYVRR
ncbi:cysteine desulfurase [Lachnospiraceae bacterium G41]|nr:cysteine desulfurase [Lachnospiraceae bacterium G41]